MVEQMLSDKKQGGRRSEININKINNVRFLIKEHSHQTVGKIESNFKEVGFSSYFHGTIMKIIQEDLEMSKVC